MELTTPGKSIDKTDAWHQIGKSSNHAWHGSIHKSIILMLLQPGDGSGALSEEKGEKSGGGEIGGLVKAPVGVVGGRFGRIQRWMP